MQYRFFYFVFFLLSFTCFAHAQPPSIEEMNQAREHFNAGVKMGIAGEFEGAIEEFNHATELNPLFAEAFLYKGLAEIEMTNYEEAVRDFTITIELDPAFSDQAHYFRGLAKYYLEQYEAAIDDLSIAILMNPDFVSFYQRGKANLKLKEYRRSLQDFDIALRLQEDFWEGYLYRGISLYYLEDYEDAMEDLELAKQHLPDNAEAHYYSGLVRLQIQNSYVAIEDLDKAIEIDPSLSQAYDARASARQNTGNNNAAEKDRQEAVKLKKTKDENSAAALQANSRTSQKRTNASTEIDFEQLFNSSPREKEAATIENQKTIVAEKTPTDTPVQKSGARLESANPPSEVSTVSDFSELESGIYNQDFNEISLRGFGVQLASYSSTVNLSGLVKAYQEKYKKSVYVNISVVNGKTLYKLIIGHFDTRMDAENFRDKLRNDNFPDSFLVVYENL